MFNSDLYDLTQNTQGNVWGAAMRARTVVPPPISPVMQIRAGYAESPGWLMIQAREFDPEPLTVPLLRKRAVWSAPGIMSETLEILVGEKWLSGEGDQYILTPAGREVLKELQSRRQAAMQLITPLPLDELQELDRLLRRILAASMVDDPWCLRYSMRRAPGTDAPLLDQIVHHFSDINAFRDDCHMAAFMPCNVEAYQWEAFTLIWQGKASTAQEILDQLVNRGYSLADYAEGLQAIQQRGWLDGNYAVTEEGRRLRQQVEDETNRLFYAPWHTALIQPEIEYLVSLLQKLHDATRPL